MTSKQASICALLVALMAVPATSQVHGRGAADEERLIAQCIYRSARGKRWLEKALFGIRDQEGGWIGAEVPNRDGSYDLGPMQINSQWVPRFARLLGRPPRRVRQWLRQDACFNIAAARWLLLQELSHTRKLWSAVGSYHSPDHDRSRRYLLAVSRKIFQRSKIDKKSFHLQHNYHFQYGGK